MDIHFVVYGQPFGKVNMRPIKFGKKLSLCNPDSNNNYMRMVQDAFFGVYSGFYPVFPKGTPIAIKIAAYYKVQSDCYNQKGLNQKGLKKIKGIERPTLKPDCDNISKVVCDALNTIAWYDDSQVVELSVAKFYSEQPRVDICISSIDTNLEV